ncbi:MAG: cell division protein ZapA [Bacteroidetes bacterium]|nr:MAG: cell division protein ZapA [Bacteroidota bacterium]
MSKKLHIKVNIGGRDYPLSVKPEEEPYVKKAVEMINENIKELKENYAVSDKIDLLSMTALLFATKVAEGKTGTAEDINLLQKTQEINDRLSVFLQENNVL